MGGMVSDRMGNRRFVMLCYMFGISVGFLLMAMLNSSWPLILAIAVTIGTSIFVQGLRGNLRYHSLHQAPHHWANLGHGRRLR